MFTALRFFFALLVPLAAGAATATRAGSTSRQLAAPSHDTCEGAMDFAPGDNVASTTVGATPDEDLFGTGVGFDDGPGVWFKFIGTGNVMHIYVACEENWDSLIKVFTAKSCDVLGDGKEEGGQGFTCNMALQPLHTEVLREYWILISGHTVDIEGDFVLSMIEDNDFSSHCDLLHTPGATCQGTFECRDFFRTCLVPNPEDNYKLTSVVGKYAKCFCRGGTIECLASGCPLYHDPTLLSRGNEQQREPQLMDPTPPNDECTDAEPVSVGRTPVAQGSTIHAAISENIFGVGVDTGGPAVWYSFQGTGDRLKLSLDCDDQPWNAAIRFISGSCSQYGGDYYGRGNMCENGAAIEGINTEAGKQYYVLVEGVDCQGSPWCPQIPGTGDFKLLLETQN